MPLGCGDDIDRLTEERVTPSPSEVESGDPTLAGLYLVIGCTAAGPALGLVSAVRLVRFPAFPGWFKALAFAGVLANGLALLLLLDLLAGFQ
ncbi:MAG: hypothetical protein EOP88_07660 [Verrucomicrobiaceae bacterium]|nr:MAG: hypothetical protein EOP88_07660 [Verrucomicrobiaceae bacterium]